MLDSSPQALRVLLVADPGLPSRRVTSIRDDFESLLQRAYSVQTTLRTHTNALRLTPDQELDLDAVTELREDYEDTDILLVLTEIPRHT